MLDLDVGKSQVAEVRRSLLDLAAAEPERFASLFEPAAKPVALDTPVEPLVRWGLLQPAEGGYLTTHRLRRQGERPYLMTTGSAEYRQDIWPETDALLAVLDGAPAGLRVLDMGTGTGIVAIEAALRGHRVVATDLYDNTLRLARFNARLHGVDEAIELRRGHLFEPAAGDTFDLVLTAPHYTRTADQLRLEALQSGLGLVAPGGRLVIATFFEWEGDHDAPIPVVETILRPLVAKGASVTVTPILSPLKKHWFSRVEPPLPGLVSRHRFLVVMQPSGGRLTVERPLPSQQLTDHFVPLSRLRLDGGRQEDVRARAILADRADVARLEELLVGLASGRVTLSGHLPTALHDACRFDTAPCVSLHDASGAAGAILDLSGQIRPCSAGGVIARVDDAMSHVLARQRLLHVEAGQRRGCQSCEALAWCPRCLFPGALSEMHYCALMRAAGPELDLLRRLWRILPTLGPSVRQVELKLRPTPSLLAARGRPRGRDQRHPSDAAVRAVAAYLQTHQTWILSVDQHRFALATRHGDRDWLAFVDEATAAVAELLLDGSGAAELAQHASDEGLDLERLGHILHTLGQS